MLPTIISAILQASRQRVQAMKLEKSPLRAREMTLFRFHSTSSPLVSKTNTTETVLPLKPVINLEPV